MAEYCYRYLPNGNTPEFPKLDAELKHRGIQAQTSDIGEGRMWRIPVEDLPKLPTDNEGPYFGDDTTGYTLATGAHWEDLRVEWGGSEWKPI